MSESMVREEDIFSILQNRRAILDDIYYDIETRSNGCIDVIDTIIERMKTGESFINIVNQLISEFSFLIKEEEDEILKAEVFENVASSDSDETNPSDDDDEAETEEETDYKEGELLLERQSALEELIILRNCYEAADFSGLEENQDHNMIAVFSGAKTSFINIPKYVLEVLREKEDDEDIDVIMKFIIKSFHGMKL